MNTRTCRIGLHGRNNVTFAEIDYQVINTAKIEALKMMGQTSPSVFKRLKADSPDIDLITRLYDDRFGVNTHPSPEEFATRQIPIINALRPYCTKFEVHNEPNHLHHYEGWGQEDHYAQDFNAWFLRVYQLLKTASPWATFGFPGLAIPHRDLEWIEICRAAIERADWLGVHCYWQTPPGQEQNHLTDFWGLRFKYYHQKFPTKIIEITECGNSNIQADPPISISENGLAQQYVEYYRELFKYPYINSASFFMLSSQDPTWDFFAWRSENGRVKPVVDLVGRMSRPTLTRPGTIGGGITTPGSTITLGGQTGSAIKITDIAASLPTAATQRYPTRSLSEVNRIIIHHTAVSEKVGPQRIAKIQVEKSGKAGISYHYFIAEDGTVYQTNALTTVSDHTNGHNQTGLAIGFAGNFTNYSPPTAQLQAGAALCVGLMLQLNISPDNINGATELINTQSPGNQWLSGQRWKDQLVAEINRLRGLSGTETPISPTQPTNAVIEQLNARIRQLSAALTEAQSKINRLESELAQIKNATPSTNAGQLAALRERIAVLELQLSIARQGSNTDIATPMSPGAATVSPPTIDNISAALPHHPTERYAVRALTAIQTLVIHHTAVPATISARQIAAFNVSKNGWPGIGFHFVINADGTILQTNSLETITFHAGAQNATSVGIAFSGEFSQAAPTAPQIDQGGHLIAWLLSRFNLPVTAIKAHKELNDTPCPGQQWDTGQMWQTLLQKAVEAYQTGSPAAPGVSAAPYHVMLFSNQQSIESAAAYISKFQPVVSMNVADTIGAKFVSVIGSRSPLSAAEEAQLKASGAEIDHVAGNTPQAIKALLDNLARINKRFLTIKGA